VVLVAVVAVALTACQVDIDVATKVNDDGSGTVTVSAGFDDKALTRVGNLDSQLKVDDLKAAGWQFTAAAKEADGLTWIRATKHFATPEEATQILKELTGGQGAFRDFAVTREASLGRTTWSYKGTVDLTGGLDQFGDPDLAKALGGDTFGGNVAAIEQAEHKPATQMLALRLSVELPGGERREWTPTFADPAATQLAAQSTQTQPLPVLSGEAGGFTVFVLIGFGLAALGFGLLVLRHRFRYAR
jgi:hypothetical protein